METVLPFRYFYKGRHFSVGADGYLNYMYAENVFMIRSQMYKRVNVWTSTLHFQVFLHYKHVQMLVLIDVLIFIHFHDQTRSTNFFKYKFLQTVLKISSLPYEANTHTQSKLYISSETPRGINR